MAGEGASTGDGDGAQAGVEVKGARINYRLWSGDPERDGLLFLHGFRAQSHWWDHIIPRFTADFRVATMDLSGFGDSGWRAAYTAGAFAEEVLAVVEACDLAPVTIVAHSFGATIAAHACALRPDMVRRLIILDARMLLAGMPEPDRAELDRIRTSGSHYASESEIRSRFRLVPPSTRVDPDLLDHIASTSYRRREDGFTWKFDPSVDPELTDDPNRCVPPGVMTKIDLVYGDRSAVVTPETAAIIVRHFRHAGTPIVIEDCDHHLMLEQPAALVSTLNALLDRS